MHTRIQEFIVNEDGPTAVEYSVMLGLIVAVCLVAIGSVGSEASQLWDFIATNMP